jgi:hypothetical protein
MIGVPLRRIVSALLSGFIIRQEIQPEKAFAVAIRLPAGKRIPRPNLRSKRILGEASDSLWK